MECAARVACVSRVLLKSILNMRRAGPDVITAYHVVKHLPDPVKTLSIMKRFVAPGGYLWIARSERGQSDLPSLKR